MAPETSPETRYFASTPNNLDQEVQVAEVKGPVTYDCFGVPSRQWTLCSTQAQVVDELRQFGIEADLIYQKKGHPPQIRVKLTYQTLLQLRDKCTGRHWHHLLNDCHYLLDRLETKKWVPQSDLTVDYLRLLAVSGNVQRGNLHRACTLLPIYWKQMGKRKSPVWNQETSVLWTRVMIDMLDLLNGDPNSITFGGTENVRLAISRIYWQIQVLFRQGSVDINPLAQQLRDRLLQLHAHVSDPIEIFRSCCQPLSQILKRKNHRSYPFFKYGITNTGNLLLWSVASAGRGKEAYEIYTAMKDLDLTVDSASYRPLWTALQSQGHSEPAYEVCMSLVNIPTTKSTNTIETLLPSALALLAGLDKVEDVESLLPRVDLLSNPDKMLGVEMSLLAMYARKGMRQQLDLLVQNNLPVAWKQLQSLRDNTYQRSDISRGNIKVLRKIISIHIKACFAANDLEDAVQNLQLLSRLDVTPSIPDFVSVISMCARRNDATSAQAIFDQLLSSGLSPNLHAYSALISAYGRTKDSRNAEKVYQTMIDSGIVPDMLCLATLINAYLEGGDWSMAGQVWKSLSVDDRQNTHIVSVMLKGLVLLAAPMAEVEKVFRQSFPDLRTADSRAWALVIQSACDSGDMGKAEALFEELIAHGQPNVYHFSIILKEYLQQRNITRAQEIFAEMRQRNVVPSSVTYGIVVKSLVEGVWINPAQNAFQLVESLLSGSDVPGRGSRSNWAEDIIGPLMTDSVRRADAEAAGAYFARIVEAGFQPSIPMYTRLLDAHRREGNLEGMQSVWAQIVAFASRPSLGEEGEPITKNALCIPLSIYMDAMSAACRHLEVARVWQDVASRGFAFDSQNWNHLVIALIRAGEPERAFKITEDVLIPMADKVWARQTKPMRPSTTNIDNANAENTPMPERADSPAHVLLRSVEGDDPSFTPPSLDDSEPASRPPNRRAEYASHPVLRQMEATSSGPEEKVHINPSYFARWRPSDITWRPSFLTIAVLERAYAQLERNRPVMALLAGSSEEEVENESEVDEAKRSSPFALMTKLNSKYTRTVSLIMFHRKKTRQMREKRSQSPRRS